MNMQKPLAAEKIMHKINTRRASISRLYNVSLPDLNIKISSLKALDFYVYCCELLESPEYFLYHDVEETPLPAGYDEYVSKTEELKKKITNIYDVKQSEDRLWSASKTTENTEKTSRATDGRRENIKIRNIKILDLLCYCSMYNTDPDNVMLGYSFREVLQEQKERKDLFKETLENNSEPENINIENKKDSIKEDNTYLLLFEICAANGKCERCDQPAPFKDKDGIPRLLLKIISEKKDPPEMASYSNSVVLCPNCYNRVNAQSDPADIKYLREKARHHSLAEVFMKQILLQNK